MKKTALIFFLIIFTLSLTGCLKEEVFSQKIVSSLSGNEIYNAKVTFYSNENIQEIRTNEDGFYSLKTRKRIEKIKYEATGFETFEVELKEPIALSEKIFLKPERALKLVVFSGKKPLSSVKVQVEDKIFKTNKEGIAYLEGLEEGQVKVLFSKYGFKDLETVLKIPEIQNSKIEELKVEIKPSSFIHFEDLSNLSEFVLKLEYERTLNSEFKNFKGIVYYKNGDILIESDTGELKLKGCFKKNKFYSYENGSFVLKDEILGDLIKLLYKTAKDSLLISNDFSPLNFEAYEIIFDKEKELSNPQILKVINSEVKGLEYSGVFIFEDREVEAREKVYFAQNGAYKNVPLKAYIYLKGKVESEFDFRAVVEIIDFKVKEDFCN